MFRKLATACAYFAIAAGAHATTVLSDTFDGENGGLSQRGYSSFQNWTASPAFPVDLVRSGDFGIVGAGSMVAFGGSAAPGLLQSANFDFQVNDRVVLRYDVSGSQQPAAASSTFTAFFEFAAPVSTVAQSYDGVGSGESFGSLGFGQGRTLTSDSPFTTHELAFTAATAGTLHVVFDSFAAFGSNGETRGGVLDNVVLTITAVPEPSTWALMVAGLGAVAALARRRRVG